MPDTISTITGNTQVTDQGVYIFPVDEELTSSDISGLIQYHEAGPRIRHREQMKYYVGDQKILHDGRDRGSRPNNHLLMNLAAYNVDTFNGFFVGVPPKITLDDDAANSELQQWQNANDWFDQLSEISKLADIYGSAYAYAYQDENGDTRTAYVGPERAFMLYDDTVAQNPLAFVQYQRTAELELQGAVYMADGVYSFMGDPVLSEQFKQPNLYGTVPAVEFVENEERRGLNDNVMTLLDALNSALSQKANNVEYFDNAYLKVLGVDLTGEDGKPRLDLDGNQVIYSAAADAANAVVDFISKPDGDTMQENHINRLVSAVYQISMVPNLNDEAFAGNSSGVALEYKLLPMRNKAVNKQRKFTPALRKLYSIIFSKNTKLKIPEEAWQDLRFQFSQNVPHNLADEATTAKDLVGITSHETLLSTLSSVDDPKTEMDRIAKEKTDTMAQALQAGGVLTDQQRAGALDGEE